MRVIKYRTVISEDGKVQLEKEYSTNVPGLSNNMASIENVKRLARSFLKLDKMSEEYLYMLCLNTRLKLLSIFEVSHGTVDCSIISPREVFQKALLANAVNIILVHNHPSGSPVPSNCDIVLTKEILEVGRLMHINLVDHIIIGSDSCASLKEMGYS